MRAIHVNWTQPFFAKHEGAQRPPPYRVPDYELITTVLSVLCWNRFQGPVDLYTDAAGAAFYEEAGLLDLYRKVDTRALEALDPRVYPPRTYFNVAKFVALRRENGPVTLMDTDLFLNAPLPELGRNDFVFAHWELRDDLPPAKVGRRTRRKDVIVYPSREKLPNPNGVDYDAWDWELDAANCALAYFGHKKHRHRFIDLALAWAANNPMPTSLHSAETQPVMACFCEQRISVFEAARLGLRYAPVVKNVFDPLTSTWLGRRFRSRFHHIWWRKIHLAVDAFRADEACALYLGELLHRFPAQMKRVEKMPALSPHLERLRTRVKMALAGDWKAHRLSPALQRIARPYLPLSAYW